MKGSTFALVSIPLAAGASFLIGDWTYSHLTRKRFRNWNQSIARHANGLRKGCEPFTHGHGPISLLFVHGFSDTPAIWHPMVSHFDTHQYTCRAMRIPEFGNLPSSWSTITHQDWKKSILEECSNLTKSITQSTSTDPHFWLVTHSTGAATALNLLLQEPRPSELAHVKGIVLLAPLFEVSNRRSPFFTPRTWYHILSSTLLFSNLLEIPFPLDIHQPIGKTGHTFTGRDTFLPMKSFHSLFDLLDENRTLFRNPILPVPLLMVLSPHDKVIDSPSAEHFYDRCSAPFKNLLPANHSGHVIHWDHDLVPTVKAIKTFITQTASTSFLKATTL